jgi:AraC-like DNA-binding protein
MSSRTLARKLAAEDLTFEATLDQLRADLATRHLQEGRLCISQVAWLVGYQGVSAFTHACRRWTGMAPGQFRHAADRPGSARKKGSSDKSLH